MGGVAHERYLDWHELNMKPLWIRWSDEKHKELEEILSEIDLSKFRQAHLFNMTAAVSVVVGIAKDLADFASITRGSELNMKAKWLKLYVESEGLEYILKHDGNRRLLSDAEMTAVLDTAFGIPYRKKDGTICRRNPKAQ